jgi:glutamate decarboxylase
VLGTTFIGENDPISELNDLLLKIKSEKGWDIPLHIDGASGGFIAPFSNPAEVWDFRLEQVRSINASGHKYGMVYAGVGWLLFRDKDALPEELVFSVNYLGGAQPTYTFNFSRNSSMIQAQYYQFVRLGKTGYKATVEAMLNNARLLDELLRKTGWFEVLNPRLPEPVVTFRVKDGADFDAFHLSDKLREHGWIVPAYSLPPDAAHVSALRVVVRNDMSRDKIEILAKHIGDACDYLSGRGMPPTDPARKVHAMQRTRC